LCSRAPPSRRSLPATSPPATHSTSTRAPTSSLLQGRAHRCVLFGQRLLDACRDLVRDARNGQQLLNGGRAQPPEASEVAEQLAAPAWSHAGHVVEGRTQACAIPEVAV